MNKTYYPSSIKNNPYYALVTDHSNETASTIIRSILNKKQPSLHSDSAATGHFITEDFPGTLITHQPLRVECANSQFMES